MIERNLGYIERKKLTIKQAESFRRIQTAYVESELIMILGGSYKDIPSITIEDQTILKRIPQNDESIKFAIDKMESFYQAYF